MSTDHGLKLEELFHAALERKGIERAAFLAEACRDNHSLRETVERLLEAHEKAFDFPGKPAWALFGPSRESGLKPGLPFERLGEFRVLRRIGEGGMGIAYLATQESLNRQVVLKVIRPERIDSAEARVRFQHEVEAVSDLNHPNIVTVYSSGEEQGIQYFAMEWVPGKGLDEVLREATSREERIPIPRILNWIKAIGEALDCAHRNGIIHRDVKPSNIRITPEGKPMLLDFSVARHAKRSTLTLTGDFRGTPQYASPQQVEGSPHVIDARTDVYSLGVTLYEAVTGFLPFQGENRSQVFHQILKKEPVPPRRVSPGISRDLETIILTAMEKEPERRYPTMGDFAGDIARLLSGDPITAQPAGIASHAFRYIRRNRAVSAVAGLAFLVVAVLAVSVPLYFAQKASTRIATDSALIPRLMAEAQGLHPAHPDRVSRMEGWLTDASALAIRFKRHCQALEDLRAQALPGGGKNGKGWTFKDSALQGRHDALAELVDELTSFLDEKTGTVRQIERLLEFSQSLHRESIEKYKDRWDRAIASISDREECPQYRGLALEPVLGLVPLGQDPGSGLWEFAHLQTGSMTERESHGELLLNENSGIVFVLIPGGRFDMGAVRPGPDKPLGAPNVDPQAEPLERPVHSVTLNPFFMSKYELTQGQWLCVTRRNPSHYDVDTRFGDKQHSLLHPVENVTWQESKLFLARLGLRLPSEAEWEYAVRAGTTTVWWTGNDKESLEGAASLMDLFYDQNQDKYKRLVEAWLNDGYVVHGPVNAFRPNPFGLHGMCGNVCEWCEDTWHPNYEDAPTDGSAWIDPSEMDRVCRDCCWDMFASNCRSAWRYRKKKDHYNPGLGVRPVMSLP